MKKYIHVNQHNIRHNIKSEDKLPVITCKTYKSNEYGNTVVVYDKDGVEACRVLYSPDKPLSCGARVWVETTNDVGVLK